MQLTDLTDRIRGYVIIQADGAFLERFLTVCTRKNLEIKNIRHLGSGRLTAVMSTDAFLRLRPVCRRTKTKVRILKRCGLPFLCRRFRRRKAVWVSLALVLAFLWYTSGHIMGITVQGNARIPTDEILEHLARCQVAVGKSTNGIDASQIRNRLMRDLEDLAWVGINVNGSRVYIEVVERLETEPKLDADTPCHLVATKDGIIESIEARNGQNMVSVGSGVRSGDLLVSGIMDADDDPTRYVHAYGEVYAITSYRASRDYPLSFSESVDTGKHTTRYRLRILDRTLSLSLGKHPPYTQWRKEETETEYRPPSERLPSLFLQKECYWEQTQEQRTRTPAQALQTARNELESELRRQLPNDASVTDCEVTHTLTEQGILSVTVTLLCRENIAAERLIETVDSLQSNSE